VTSPSPPGGGQRCLFIVTYGRSGSTLLQSIIASNPGYRIRGENNDAVFHLFRSYRKLLRAKEVHGKRRRPPDHPWYGIDLVEPEHYARKLALTFIDEVIQPSDGDRVVGFKEIRYIHHLGRLEEFLDFLLSAFAPAKIVFNIRNADAVKRSRWWARRPEKDVLAKLGACVEAFRAYAAKHRESCWVANYDEYAKDAGALNGLFDFLGEPFRAEKIQAILSVALKH
jgi:hypothetical protein